MKFKSKILAGTAAAAAIMLGLAGCTSGSPETPDDTPAGVDFKIAVQDDFSHMPIYVAQEQGFFEENGISSVELVKLTDLPAMTAAVSQGQVDAGFQTPILTSNFNASTDRSPLKFFSPGAAPTWDVIARTGSGVPENPGDWRESVQSWKGLRVGVPALGGSVDFMFRYLVREAGLSEEDLAWVAIGPTPAMLASLQTDQIDLVAGDSILGPTAINDGAGFSAINLFAGEGPDLFNDVFVSAYFASEETIAENEEVYIGFRHAIEKAQQWLLDPANADEVARIIQERLEGDPSIAKELAGQMSQFDITLDEGTLERTLHMYSELGSMTGDLPSFDDLVSATVRE